MTTALELVTSLIAACNRSDVDAAVALFSDDAIYHNIPIAPVRGPAEIRAMLGGFLTQANEVDWVVHYINADAKGVVVTERTDRFRFGEQWLELPVMGIFETEGGRIAAWRDYFDMAPLQAVLQPQ